MRIRSALLSVLLLAFPFVAFSQTTLNFPRAFTPADLASTGFTVLNPGTTDAAVTFTLYNSSGAIVAQCVLPCSKSTALSSPGQFAALGTELFPTTSESGWVQLTSATSGLQGFWLGGDFATFTDGADGAQTSSDLVFPVVTSNTELNIANTSTSTNSVTIRIYGEAGTELGTAVTSAISPKGFLQSQTSALFPAASLNTARYVRVTGASGLAGTAVINGMMQVNEWGVTNAVTVAAATTEANFPQVVSGVGAGGNYTTLVGVTNLSSSSQTVTITFTPTETPGVPVTIQRTIAANGSIRDTAQNLFSFTSFQNGWVKVTGTASLTAFVAYAESVAGGLTVVPVQTTPRTAFMFSHIADVSPWWTGLGLLNTNSSDAIVSVYAMNTNGTLIGGPDTVATAQLTIPAGAKVAKLLTELIPQSETRGENGGFIYIASSQPLYGVELFFTRSLRIVANVAAGSGFGFAPPAAAPPVLTSIAPTKATVGSTITLTGSGFSTTAANNTVVFTGASGAMSATAATATTTSLTVDVPQGAISGPVSVRVGSQSSASLMFEVLTSWTSGSSGTPFTVTSGTTATGIDIVVPPPAGSLNVTVIGIGDPGTAIGFSGSSVDISRGQTKQLVFGATGLSQANGSTVSISGGGVTIGAVTFQSGFMRVTITASASAITGPRDVIVTNSNLDTSILSGGLFIR